VAAIRAARRALVLNRACGDRLRLRLAGLVYSFRRSVARRGWYVGGARFPVQIIAVPSVAAAHEALLRLGVQTVPQRAGLSFVLTVRHTHSDIEQAVRALHSIGPRLRGKENEQFAI
jgi:8-amino-7-oxononanoate synthase